MLNKPLHTLNAIALAILALPNSAVAQNLNINGVTIDTGSGNTLGTLNSRGGMDEFSKLQKEMVFSVLKHLGIDPQSLPPQIRGQIERPQTNNAQALEAFARGLDLADKGQFADAAAAFKEAAKSDPGFTLATTMSRLMPSFNLGSDPNAGSNAVGNMRQNSREEGNQQANQHLDQLNQPGDDLTGLGLSEGSELGEGETGQNPFGFTGPQNVGERQFGEDGTRNFEDQQRSGVSDVVNGGSSNTYMGFASGIFYYCPDGCFEYPIASGSSSSVLINYRPDAQQVDVELSIAGDMLTNSISPEVTLGITSLCSSNVSDCANGTDPYSYYDSHHSFAAYSEAEGGYGGVISNVFVGLDDTNQFSHSTWGYWVHRDDIADYEFDAGYWVAGNLTPAANIPNSGSASYTGGMVGLTKQGEALVGEMNWNVNFATRSVSGSFDSITKDGAAWINSAAVSGGWSAGTNAVSASITGAGVSSGNAKGAFFGPSAQELGGTWRINHTNGDKGAGIFLGKPGGSPFQSTFIYNNNNN